MKPGIIAILLLSCAVTARAQVEGIRWSRLDQSQQHNLPQTLYSPNNNAKVDSVWAYLGTHGTIADTPVSVASLINGRTLASLTNRPYTIMHSWFASVDSSWLFSVAGGVPSLTTDSAKYLMSRGPVKVPQWTTVTGGSGIAQLYGVLPISIGGTDTVKIGSIGFADSGRASSIADSAKKVNHALVLDSAKRAGSTPYADSAGKVNHALVLDSVKRSATTALADSAKKVCHSDVLDSAKRSGTTAVADSSAKVNHALVLDSSFHTYHATLADSATHVPPGSFTPTHTLVDLNTVWTAKDTNISTPLVIAATAKPATTGPMTGAQFMYIIKAADMPSNTNVTDYQCMIGIYGKNVNVSTTEPVNWIGVKNSVEAVSASTESPTTTLSYWCGASIFASAALAVGDTVGFKMWVTNTNQVDSRGVTIYIIPRKLNIPASTDIGASFLANQAYVAMTGTLSGVTYTAGGMSGGPIPANNVAYYLNTDISASIQVTTTATNMQTLYPNWIFVNANNFTNFTSTGLAIQSTAHMVAPGIIQYGRYFIRTH